MSAQDGLTLYVLEAELAHVESPQAGVLLGVWGVVPGVQLKTPKHDGLYHVAALRHLSGQAELLLQRQGRRSTNRARRGDKQAGGWVTGDRRAELQLLTEDVWVSQTVSVERTRRKLKRWRKKNENETLIRNFIWKETLFCGSSNTYKDFKFLSEKNTS